MVRVRMMIIAGVALALATPNAMAQGKGGKFKYEPPPDDRPKVSDREYKAASDRIPAAQQSNDPWAGAREPSPDPSATPAAAKTRKKP